MGNQEAQGWAVRREERQQAMTPQEESSKLRWGLIALDGAPLRLKCTVSDGAYRNQGPFKWWARDACCTSDWQGRHKPLLQRLYDALPGLNPLLESGTRPDLGDLSNCLHDVWRCLFQWVSVSELRW